MNFLTNTDIEYLYIGIGLSIYKYRLTVSVYHYLCPISILLELLRW